MQKKLVLILTIFCFLTILALSLAIVRSPILGNLVFLYDSSKNPINIDFKFGVTARNELNTFNGTFTKDLIIDGTIKTRLILSQQELTQIKTKLFGIGFFDYPPSFQSQGTVSPRSNYLLKVQIGSVIKEVSWYSDSNLDPKTGAALNELYNLMTDTIIQKLEYKLLPAANGGYC